MTLNPNFKGDIRVRGEKIEDFVRRIIAATVTQDVSPPAPAPLAANATTANATTASEFAGALSAFNDEKTLIMDSMTCATKKIDELEALISRIAEEVRDLGKTVFDATLDWSTQHAAIAQKIDAMKPRRGVDQGTLDAAIAEIEREVHGVKDDLARLRAELTDD